MSHTHTLVYNRVTQEELVVLPKYAPDYAAGDWENVGPVPNDVHPSLATRGPGGTVIKHQKRHDDHVEATRRAARQLHDEINAEVVALLRGIGIPVTDEQIARHLPNASPKEK